MRSYHRNTEQRVREALLEQVGPMDHEELMDELELPESHVGQALMNLYDEDMADWPSPDRWIAIPDEEHAIDGPMATIKIGVVNDQPSTSIKD